MIDCLPAGAGPGGQKVNFKQYNIYQWHMG